MPGAGVIPFPIRAAVVAALALAAMYHVVRSAIVQHWVTDRPALAAKVWPSHPRVLLAVAMEEIGKSARAGQAPSAQTVARSMSAARRDPLAVKPLLISGAIAQSEKEDLLAEKLFFEAARRDPRSTAARFFLAQRYLATGRPGEGLRHASVLMRLVAGGSAALVPAISQYAKTPDALPTLRKMFAGDTALREAVLADLARDAANYRLIMKLAGDRLGSNQPLIVPQWEVQLLRSLLDGGRVAQAHAFWSQISGLRSPPKGVFNPQFAKLNAPPPFNWTLSSGEFGFAEPIANGGLQVIYYGRANAEFANQTLLLSPGNYELRMKVLHEGNVDVGSGLAWTVECSKSKAVFLNMSLGGAKGAGRAIGGRFTIPPGCAVQTLKLAGTAREPATSEHLSIENLLLVRHPS